MIDVVNKKCEKCTKGPYFGYEGERARFCAVHKEDDMVNVRDRRCEKCAKQPCFGYDGDCARFCVNHKEADMIDVVNKKCEKCLKIPAFGYEGERARFCAVHKEADMTNVRDKQCEKCYRRPTYGYDGECARFCVAHKECDMIDVKHDICPGYNGGKCPVRTRVNDKKYCMVCDPDENRRKHFKLMENVFFDYINGKLDIHKREYHVSFVSNETAKKFARLDGIVIREGIIVCIEVDEDGHRDYECDEHRMHLVNGELLQKYPEHNVAWVRVNPTTSEKNQWSEKSKRIRYRRFDDVIKKVNEILMTKYTEITYIGFT